MTRRGRKPTGPQLVEHLDGSEHAKLRLKVILQTVIGQRTIPDACEALGICESMFHKLRSAVLQAALGRLEPRPLGRPPRQIFPTAPQMADLESEIQDLRIELRAAQVRRELAEKLPRLSKAADSPGKKTSITGRQSKSRRASHRAKSLRRPKSRREPNR
jgi:hypothetical protein